MMIMHIAFQVFSVISKDAYAKALGKIVTEQRIDHFL
jgi:hypothetical protein